MRHAASGFTLIELMIVIVIIAILAIIALPRFVNTREKSYIASMKSDLRNLATAEENYFAAHYTYTNDVSQLQVVPSGRVLISIPEAQVDGFRATATFEAAPHLACELYYGNASGQSTANLEGVVMCNN